MARETKREAYLRWLRTGTTRISEDEIPVSSGSTYRPTSGNITKGVTENHMGLDFGGNIGTPIFATKGGTVISPSKTSGYGLNIMIRSTDGRYEYLYGHLSRSDVRVGQQVRAGQLIGALGATGTTDPHLHYEKRLAGMVEKFIKGWWTPTSAINPTLGFASAPPSGQVSYSSALSWLTAGRGMNVTKGTTAQGDVDEDTDKDNALAALFKLTPVGYLIGTFFPSAKEKKKLKESGIATLPIKIMATGVGIIIFIIAYWQITKRPRAAMTGAALKGVRVAKTVASGGTTLVSDSILKAATLPVR